MTAKYSIDQNDTRIRSGVTLYRIKRPDGTKGGFVQSEANLNQAGSCWIHGDSEVFSDARVSDDAQIHGSVFGRATVSGNSKVSGQVFDSASVGDYAEVSGRVFGHAVVRGGARVIGEASENAVVEGNALVLGRIHGNARASGNDVVTGDRGGPGAADAPGGAGNDPPSPLGSSAADVSTVPIVGYVSLALADGSRRVYLDATRSIHVDIPQPDRNIVAWVDIDKSTGLARLYVRADAKVDVGRITRSVSASVLAGRGPA
jgi:hypothetical protein